MLSIELDDFNNQLMIQQAPYKVAIHLNDIYQTFITESGLVPNSQQHKEITRQCFDKIDLGFSEYSREIMNLPMIHLLIDNERYTDSYGNISQTGLNLKSATQKYAIGIYFACMENGIFIEQRTPYMLEEVVHDMCLLQKGF